MGQWLNTVVQVRSGIRRPLKWTQCDQINPYCVFQFSWCLSIGEHHFSYQPTSENDRLDAFGELILKKSCILDKQGCTYRNRCFVSAARSSFTATSWCNSLIVRALSGQLQYMTMVTLTCSSRRCSGFLIVIPSKESTRLPLNTMTTDTNVFVCFVTTWPLVSIVFSLFRLH